MPRTGIRATRIVITLRPTSSTESVFRRASSAKAWLIRWKLRARSVRRLSLEGRRISVPAPAISNNSMIASRCGASSRYKFCIVTKANLYGGSFIRRFT